MVTSPGAFQYNSRSFRKLNRLCQLPCQIHVRQI
jgi:hypothetical protein